MDTKIATYELDRRSILIRMSNETETINTFISKHLSLSYLNYFLIKTGLNNMFVYKPEYTPVFDQSFTLFAPTDEAFKALLVGQGLTNKDQLDLNLVKNILQNHIVSSVLTTSMIRNMGTKLVMTAINGTETTITLVDSLSYAYLTSTQMPIIGINNMDNYAYDGIIHVIDTVIL